MEDRALVAAVKLEKGERCPTCNTAEWEWDEDPDAYIAKQVVCLGCAARDRARASDDTDTSMPGASIRLLTRKVAEAMVDAVVRRPASRRERSTR